MAETLIISRTKLTVPRPRIPGETNPTEKLTVDFTAKKSSPSSGKLTVSADSYNAILEEMHPPRNESADAENRLPKNEARQAELADAQDIVRRVGGRPSSQRPDKTRTKSKRGQWSSSEEDRATQKRRTQARGEAKKPAEEEETELGRLEFARTLSNDPAKLTHLRRVLPPRDYQQLEARLVFWKKFEEREKNLASLAQQAAVAHAWAQKKWDRARESLALSLASASSPKEYSLGEMTEILRQAVNVAEQSHYRDIELADARRLHLAITFEEPSDPEPQNTPDKPDREKNPMFGLAVRLNTDTDRIAKKLYTITKQ